MWQFKRSMSLLLIISVIVFLSVLAAHPAGAVPERRVALVIGNGAYKVAPALPNPTIDAKAVAATLRRIGVEVIEGYDLTIAQMRAKLAEFASAIPGSEAALVFYAGHGVSVDEENYLLPTDIALRNPSDLDLGAISLTLVLKQMKREERVNVVILDACRDNPFATELARTHTRSAIADRGLSRVENDLAKGTLIAFASDPKSAAMDGTPGENSPFSKALLNHLEDAGVSIDTIMSRVRTEVWTETKNKQLPWVSTSIIGEFILNPEVAALEPGALPPRPGSSAGAAAQGGEGALPSRSSPAQERLAQETRLWDSAERSNLVGDYQAYLDAYPSGTFARMAKNRIASLGGEKATSPIADPPVDFNSDALKAEVGTQQSETSLALTPEKRKDVQQRLRALDHDPGKTSGDFTQKTRDAILAWQNSHALQATGWLGPLQYAALLAESEAPMRRDLAGKTTEPRPEAAPRTRKMVASPAHAAPRQAAPRPRVVRQQGGGGGDPGAAAFMGGVVGGALGGILGRIH